MSALCVDGRPCPVATQAIALLVATVLGAALAALAGGPTFLALGYPTLGLAGAVMLVRADRRQREHAPPFPRRPARITAPRRPEHVPARPREPERGLWQRGPGAGERALGYVRVEHDRGRQFARHARAIERLCEARGLGLTEIACDVDGAAGSASAQPGLTWALDRLAAGDAGAFVVARLDHLTGMFGERRQIVRWFRERGLTVLTAEHGPGAPAFSVPNPSADAPVYPARVRGVDPRSWAAHAHTHS